MDNGQLVNFGLGSAIAAELTALDNFSITTALLEINTADASKISLVASDDLTIDLNSNVAVSDRLFSSAETISEINLAVF